MIAPVGADSFREALRWGAEVYQALKSVLKSKGLATGLGDEGGFAPDLPGTRAALDLIGEAVEKAGYQLGRDIALALDVAATEFHSDGVYSYEGKKLSAAGAERGLRRAGRGLPAGVHRGPAERGRLGRLGRAHHRDRRQGAAGRRRPVRHQPGAARGRHRPRRGQRAAGEGQPDRDALGDPGRGHAGPVLGLPLHDEPPLRARPRTPRSPTSPWPPAAVRSRPAPRPGPSGWPSTTSCCGSRSRSATPPATPATWPSRGPRAASSARRLSVDATQ